ncbi:hypothetical protein TRFO_31307 [Tritrichomonas foetus]|uniref:Protein kinase domain-containing protein n=1 Tax=Tritrichomonas foetus TaxID=1144522 RepID=A0A1J4JW49_9EUKA|nr:hypothetical protein TRFO_31307 [Tritrichomonas foetus]|eukprot:OHT01748.1 hypothetical protein TRFO_31307 [Tritrichomonas foetus]
MLNYFLSHPVNGQYTELYELWCSWAVQSSMLLFESFSDPNSLCYAHYLDLKDIYESLSPIVHNFPKQIGLALRKKLHDIQFQLTVNDITTIIDKIPDKNELKTESKAIIKTEMINSQYLNISESAKDNECNNDNENEFNDIILSEDDLFKKFKQYNYYNYKNFNSKIVESSQFEIIELVYENEYSKVYRANLKPQNKEVAVKELKAENITDSNVNNLKNALNTLQQLDHPNIIKLEATSISCPNSISIRIATKYVKNGSLYEFMKQKENIQRLTPNLKLQIVLGVIRGLEYLDAMHFIHFTLNTRSILLDNDFNAIISDFYVSKRVNYSQQSAKNSNYFNHIKSNNKLDKILCNHRKNNTNDKISELLEFIRINNQEFLRFISPEVFTEDENCYTPSIDIYSFGFILWELLMIDSNSKNSNILQYSKYNPTQIAAMVVEKDFRPRIPTNTPEMERLIKRCWDTDPNKRPRATTIRKSIENGEIYFKDTNMDEFLNWANESKKKHEAIMNKIYDYAAKKETLILEKLSNLNPLDPATLQLLHELQQFEYSISPNLLTIVFKFMNQFNSLEVQDEAVNLLKQILSRGNIGDILEPSKLIDKIFSIIGSHPYIVISAVRIIAPKISNIQTIVQKLLDMPHSHVTIELLIIVIYYNYNRIPPNLLIHILNSLSSKHAFNFFKFVIMEYGPLPELLPSACKSNKFLTFYVKYLSKMCTRDFQKVHKIVNLPDNFIQIMNSATLKQILESIAILIVNPDSKITENTAKVMFQFLVKKCIKCKATKTALYLLCICIRIGCMRQIIVSSNVWGIILPAIVSDDDEILQYALRLVDKLPMSNDFTLVQKLWVNLLRKYNQRKLKSVAHTICSLLKRRNDLDLSLLVPTILVGFSSDDPQFCVTSIKIARNLNADVLEMLSSETICKNFTEQLNKRNENVCLAIGKMITTIIDKIPNFTFDGKFYFAILSLLYDINTPFDVAMPFIMFFGKLSKIKDVIMLLKKESFVLYLKQLPWRYMNDSRVNNVIEFYTSCLSQHYTYYTY